jgi:hypothetical protein
VKAAPSTKSSASIVSKVEEKPVTPAGEPPVTAQTADVPADVPSPAEAAAPPEAAPGEAIDAGRNVADARDVDGSESTLNN